MAPPNAAAKGSPAGGGGVSAASSSGAKTRPDGSAWPEYSWRQVAEHATAESNWMIMGDDVLDVTEFQSKHPGGREMLALAAGRDVTDLFAQYHVMNEEAARKYLACMKIGVLAGPTEFPRFSPDTGFYSTLRTRVKEHLAKRGITNVRPMLPGIIAVVPQLVVAAVTFCVMYGVLLPGAAWGLRLAAAVVFGIVQVLPLMHWLHDASHAAIGGSEGWWKFFGRLSMDFLAGASVMPWHHQHVLGHHVLTNVFGADPDLPMVESGDPRRVVERQRWTWLYGYQHLYLPIIYGILGLKIRISDFTDFVFRKTNGPLRVNWYSNVFWRIFVSKAVWVAWRFLLPIYVLHVPVGEVLALAAVADVMSGYWLAYNFQVSHLTEDVAWPNGGVKEDKMVLDDSWAVNQVKTSLDYGHDSRITTYLSGALNYQVEHHLFPGFSQYLLPEISPIVKATCAEYKLPFRYEPNFFRALLAHFKFLKDMGAAGREVHMD